MGGVEAIVVQHNAATAGGARLSTVGRVWLVGLCLFAGTPAWATGDTGDTGLFEDTGLSNDDTGDTGSTMPDPEAPDDTAVSDTGDLDTGDTPPAFGSPSAAQLSGETGGFRCSTGGPAPLAGGLVLLGALGLRARRAP